MDLKDSRHFASEVSRSQALAIALAEGDGIGPEVMDATLRVLDAAGARLAITPVAIGEVVYRAGHSSGIAPESWAAIKRAGMLLKGPVTTPSGGGYKSVNVTLRKTLGLYANVRPCVAYHPYVATRHPAMDLVVIRENEEDLYAGIEHRQTDDVVQCLKLISRPGCERIVRYAFEYARRAGRGKVSCFTKDNIMKMTDGLFHRVFDEVGSAYPDIAREHLIVDAGAAKLADDPARFDVVVMPNLYGDVLSDVAAEIAGSIGLAGSANVGLQGAMFEAIHGSAPDIAGQDIANPSGVLLAAVMMLAHGGQGDVARRVHNAWLRTIEDGAHTADIQGPESRHKLGTRAFADAVIENLGEAPRKLRAADYPAQVAPVAAPVSAPRRAAHKELVGVDVFFHFRAEHAVPLLERLAGVCGEPGAASLAGACDGALPLRLQMVTNRGVKVWPDGHPETFCTDHWRCRFVRSDDGHRVSHAEVVALLHRIGLTGLDFIKTENLYTFDGEPGYALGQGQ